MRKLINTGTRTPIRYMQIPSGVVDYEATPLRTVDDVFMLYYKKVINSYAVSANPLFDREGFDTFKVFDPMPPLDTNPE